MLKQIIAQNTQNLINAGPRGASIRKILNPPLFC